MHAIVVTPAAPPVAPQLHRQSDIRIPELDGFRGLMTLFVLFSHYFGEVPHGVSVFHLGWVAVVGFFVLSGYLVGRLVIEKQAASNFLPVFYLRRVCRTFPTYFVTAVVLLLLAPYLAESVWMDNDPHLPEWSYLLFAQNLFMITRNSYGLHWLSPTWTLALEEQFYIIIPFLFLLLPRRQWLIALVSLCLAGVLLRAVGVCAGWITVAPLALLPTSADMLCIGLVLAVLIKDGAIDWQRWKNHLRAAPILCLILAAGAQQLDHGEIGPWFQITNPFLVSAASAFLILMLVKGAPEAKRFRSKLLRFFGDISYSVYLTHLFVLSLMHGLILGATPDIATMPQLLVTLAAIPICTGVGWLMTKTLEQPITAWGRTFRW
jgi:peptidoglycan/LPS O-acetylase OafA/YrhL